METGITFTFAAIFLGAAVLSRSHLREAADYHCLHRAWRGSGTLWAGRCVRYGLVSGAGHVGIILLLFLLGLDMKPVALWNSLRQSTLVALISAAVFASTGYGLSLVFGFSGWDAI